MHRPDYRAAWVPEVEDRSWDDAADLAIEWTRGECAEQGAKAVVLFETIGGVDYLDNLGPFARQNFYTSVRSRAGFTGAGPVLAYVPSNKAMGIAASYARRSSLCVVESSLDPLLGWAMEVKALDLTTGTVTPDTRSAELREALGSLVFNGNNGWADSYGKQQAARILAQMRERGELDRDTIIGHTVAHHTSDRAVKRLDQLIERHG